MGNGGAKIVVTEINVYPVKSCRGISLPSANLVATGLEWDRQWLVINANGRFVTQRQLPKMALVEVSLPVEALDRNSGPLRQNSALCLKAPGMEPLHVPLLPSSPREKVPASMWEWSGHAFDEGPLAAEWLSNFLGMPTRLVRFDTVGEIRSTDPQYASGYKTAFSDGYPILVASRESLDAVNERLPEALPMNRFRPNIVVKGCEGFAEDLWRSFKIGDFKFQELSCVQGARYSLAKMPFVRRPVAPSRLRSGASLTMGTFNHRIDDQGWRLGLLIQ